MSCYVQYEMVWSSYCQPSLTKNDWASVESASCKAAFLFVSSPAPFHFCILQFPANKAHVLLFLFPFHSTISLFRSTNTHNSTTVIRGRVKIYHIRCTWCNYLRAHPRQKTIVTPRLATLQSWLKRHTSHLVIE